MGNGDDRDLRSMSDDISRQLRDARLSGSTDVQSMINATMKRLSINGRGVTGGGLSFAVGETGLGVASGEGLTGDVRDTQQAPEFTVVPLPDIHETNTTEIHTSPISTSVAPIPFSVPPPQYEAYHEIASPPNTPETPSPQYVGNLTTVTGAVNGVPAIIQVYVEGDWEAI